MRPLLPRWLARPDQPYGFYAVYPQQQERRLRHAFFTLDQSEVDACADLKCGMKRIGALIHPRSGTLVDRYLVRKADAMGSRSVMRIL